MSKVKISQEQAEALESALECCNSKEYIIENAVNGIWTGNRKSLNELSLDSLIRALYIGYELERSPEEKVKAYYYSLLSLGGASMAAPIKETLNFLNIKIDGVNC